MISLQIIFVSYCAVSSLKEIVVLLENRNYRNKKFKLISQIATFYRHLIIQATRIVLSKVSQALKMCNGNTILPPALSVKNLFRLLIPIHKAFKDLVLAEALSMKMLNINFLSKM